MSEIKCPNIKIYKCSDGFVTDNAQVAKSHEANIKSNKLICPFCGEKIEHIEDGWCNCKNRCTGSGSIELWLQFLRTRKALDVAVDALKLMYQGNGDPQDIMRYIDNRWTPVRRLCKQTLEQITALEQKDIK